METIETVEEWAFRYPVNATLVAWETVHMEDRSRKDFGDLEELAMNIKKNGLLHPPTVTFAPQGHTHLYILVGGERRMQAMKLLEVEFFPVNIREQLEQHEIFELELMENFHRKAMLWQEQCILIDKTHREKVRVNALDSKSWGTRETGSLLGVSNAHVAHATVIAPMLKQGDSEVIAASTLFAAYEVLMKRKEDAAAAKVVQHLNDTASRASAMSGGIRATTDDSDDVFGDGPPTDLNAVSTEFSPEGLDEFLGTPTPVGKLKLDLTQLFQLGDCIELMSKMPEACVDHIVTDPPYGIDLKQMTAIKNIETVIDTHDVDQNISMFEPFLTNAFRIVKPNGYVCFWCDISHWEKFMDIAERVGFKAQRWPLVWHKLHPCLNNAPRVNFTKNIEFVVVLRKSKDAALVEPQTSSVFTADGTADRKLYDNPFAKPLAAWKFILKAIAYQGQTIFDPYAGQMSCGRACINMGMIPMGCEIDPDHYNKGIVQLTKLVKEINGDK